MKKYWQQAHHVSIPYLLKIEINDAVTYNICDGKLLILLLVKDVIGWYMMDHLFYYIAMPMGYPVGI